jgi:O-antigen/teichoic acid export membrane protein
MARTAAFAMTLVLPILMVRLFDQDQFGTYRLALVVTNTAVVILGFGVGMSAFYFLPRLNESERRQIIFNITAYHAATGALAIACTAIWPDVLSLVTGSEALTPLTPTIGLMMALMLFAGFAETVATANQDIRISTAFIVGVQLTRAVMIVIAAYYFRTVSAVLWAWIIQAVLQSVCLVWYLHSRFPSFWRAANRKMAAEHVGYVLPFGLTAILTILQIDIHNYIVSYQFDAAAFAVYAVGTAQVPLLGLLRDSLNSVMQGRMSKLQQDGDKPGMLKLMLRTWRTLGLIYIPTAVGLTLLAPDFITALYTDKYAGSVPIFRLNLALVILSLFVTDAVLRAFAEHRMWVLRNRVIILLTQLALSAVLVPLIGMAGAFLAVVLSWTLERVLSLRLVFRTLGFNREHTYILRELGHLTAAALGAVVITAAVLTGMQGAAPVIRLTVGILVFAATYLSAIGATGFLNPEERQLISSGTNRLLRMAPGRAAARNSP